MNPLPYSLPSEDIFCCISNILLHQVTTQTHWTPDVHNQNSLHGGLSPLPLEDSICSRFVPVPWSTGTQSHLTLGVRRKPILATSTTNHFHGWQCPISSWLQRSGCGQDAVWQGRLGCPCLLPGSQAGSAPARGLSSSSSASQQCLHRLCISNKDERHSWIPASTTTDNKTHRRHLTLAQQGQTCQRYPVRRLQPNHNKVMAFGWGLL